MSHLQYDRERNEWVDRFGNRFVHVAAFRELWERGRLLKGQGARPTVSEYLAVAAPYFRENPNGGALHIVVADDNLENKSVEFCYQRALEDGDGYGAA